MPGLPKQVTISEVGPRDGLQIEAKQLAAEVKIALVERLAATGLTRVEVTGFAHPKIVPQLADAEKVFAGLKRRPGVRYAAFVPNAKGAERAIAAGADDLKTGIGASDTFNELNVRMTTEQGMRALDEIAALARGSKSTIVGVVATAFGCPYEGPVSPDRVRRLFEQLVGHGAPIIYLADTTGVANPSSIRRTLENLASRWPNQRIGLHLHNTRGLGLANALAGLEAGVADFESSIGGLGGCPFAPRAVGNISTEDFVHMLHEMGIETGVDLNALIEVARFAQEALGRNLPGMVMKAGLASELHDRKAQRVKVD
ncbi:MAG: hydroxymethylglutaryl-CoA lyase [Xanthobacteraceae bacterium]